MTDADAAAANVSGPSPTSTITAVTLSRPPRSSATAHQLPSRLAGIAEASEIGSDEVVGDLVAQAIGAEQEPSAWCRDDLDEVGTRTRVHSHRPGDHGALAVGARLVGGDRAFAHEIGHNGVVLRQLQQLAVAKKVGTRVADVDNEEQWHAVGAVALGCHEHRERRAHPEELLGRDRRLQHLGVETFDHGAHVLDTDRSVMGCERSQPVGHDLRGDLAATVSAHPVGDSEEPFVHDDVAVLIRCAHTTWIGGDT